MHYSRSDAMYIYICMSLHIILIPNQPGFGLTPTCCMLSEKAANVNLIVFDDFIPPGLEHTICVLDASTLTITPPDAAVFLKTIQSSSNMEQ